MTFFTTSTGLDRQVFDRYQRRSVNSHESDSARSTALNRYGYDGWFVFAVMTLLAVGIVMVGSASVDIAERQLGQPFYYLLRQSVFIVVGLCAAVLVMNIDLQRWQRSGGMLLITAVLMLVLVLVPGIGHEVNGSMRWLSLGIFNLQPSELTKLFVIIYLSGYLVRRREEVRNSIKGFARPMLLLTLVCLLLLAEPDFGAVAIMMATAVAFWRVCACGSSWPCSPSLAWPWRYWPTPPLIVSLA